ncbi:hypothetical protein JX265_002479 [Neoarthrinium moseri]|uniref:Sugar phosphate transporter domain-containing protein n=1 Tax=Neoarthrinium moseri TaxID=1658444 RepID=A0A9P9WUG1_9PEZI|nr:uncharacterized protein JN550_000293 [Neoarthrinium moseri]KAI1854840.1 hypothetical protein JX266_000958 [Neoarthrinium moseri]KAI1878111.1 hypothetical protein JN550_000293 [Neoarthrinium moseri]KAI1879525.1 hypothetical protein JX265_002479 [Neoarthrinium moseri]
MQTPRSATFPRPLWASGTKMPELHPAFYIAAWIFFSNVTILFNKWLLDTAGFPIILTTIHLAMATLLTQLLSRFSTLLDSRHNIRLTGRVYLRTILPIGVLYMLSLVCSNLAYLYLSVPFIQMLKAFAPVSTLFLSFGLGLANPRVSVLGNVLVIAAGVLLSSLGEVRFSWLGFAFQMGGTVAESLRLLLIQGLLSKDGDGEAGGAVKGIGMDPLVGLYYYAPVCAVLNGFVALVTEVPTFDWSDLERVGWGLLALSGLVAFMLNVASVFLIGRTSALAMNLTGIFKSILLVVVSMMIWNTPVTMLQTLGYAIALLGMMYYSMGPEAARSHLEACKAWLRENTNGGRVRNLFTSPYETVPSSDPRLSDVERGETEPKEEVVGAAERENAAASK